MSNFLSHLRNLCPFHLCLALVESLAADSIYDRLDCFSVRSPNLSDLASPSLGTRITEVLLLSSFSEAHQDQEACGVILGSAMFSRVFSHEGSCDGALSFPEGES